MFFPATITLINLIVSSIDQWLDKGYMLPGLSQAAVILPASMACKIFIREASPVIILNSFKTLPIVL